MMRDKAISGKAKVLCLAVLTLTVSGCGSSSGDSSDIIDPQSTLNDAISSEGSTAPETTVSMEAASSIATQIPTVNSLEMDAFIKNPLTAAVPAELRDGSSTLVTRNYIVNPLIN